MSSSVWLILGLALLYTVTAALLIWALVRFDLNRRPKVKVVDPWQEAFKSSPLSFPERFPVTTKSGCTHHFYGDPSFGPDVEAVIESLFRRPSGRYKPYIPPEDLNMEPRVINTHIPPGLARVATDLIVQVDDEPGSGGACHRYLIASQDDADEDSGLIDCGPKVWTRIDFQNGPIPEKDVNGVTIEALLAVCIDRLEGFQSGKFACEANQTALDSLKTALSALHSRTFNPA